MRIIFPDSQLLETQLKYYVHGDESRRAQNTIIEFAFSLKTQKRNLLHVGLWYVISHDQVNHDVWVTVVQLLIVHM